MKCPFFSLFHLWWDRRLKLKHHNLSRNIFIYGTTPTSWERANAFHRHTHTNTPVNELNVAVGNQWMINYHNRSQDTATGAYYVSWCLSWSFFLSHPFYHNFYTAFSSSVLYFMLIAVPRSSTFRASGVPMLHDSRRPSVFQYWTTVKYCILSAVCLSLYMSSLPLIRNVVPVKWMPWYCRMRIWLLSVNKCFTDLNFDLCITWSLYLRDELLRVLDSLLAADNDDEDNDDDNILLVITH